MVNFIKEAIDFAYNNNRVLKSLAARTHPDDYEPVNITANAFNSSDKFEKIIRVSFDYMQKSSYSVKREDLVVRVGLRGDAFEIIEIKSTHET